MAYLGSLTPNDAYGLASSWAILSESLEPWTASSGVTDLPQVLEGFRRRARPPMETGSEFVPAQETPNHVQHSSPLD